MYIGQGSGNPVLHTVNPNNGATIPVGNSGLGFAAIGGMDFDSAGTLYAAVNIAGDGGTGSDHLATLNKNTGQATIIGPFGACVGVPPIPVNGAGSCTIEGIEGIAFDNAGNLWGAKTARGAAGAPGLYLINLGTGQANFVTPILDLAGSPPSGGVTSIQFACDGTLYGGTARGLGVPDGGFLITINPANGLFSFVGPNSATSGSSLGGLAFDTACIDHYLGYKAKETKDSPEFMERLVHLADQFGTGTFNVEKPEMLFNPVDKNGEGISDEFTHLKAYKIKEGQNNIVVENQFGRLVVDTTKAELLLVPTAKSHDGPTEPLERTNVDHYKCYKVKIDKDAPIQFVPLQVTLFDPNFGVEKLFDVKKPKMLCNPVDKNGEGIMDEETHLMCYDVKPAKGEPKHKKISVFTNNQFGPEQLDVKEEKQLCVPSTKTLQP